MQVNVITSRDNSLLKKIRSLDDSAARRELGLFLVEGLKLVAEALAKQVQLVDVIVSKSFFEEHQNSETLFGLDTVALVEDRVFNTITTTAGSCGIVATAARTACSLEGLLSKDNYLFVLGESIQDPGNLGTMIRTALAFGAGGLILSKGSVDYLSPKVVRASMGAVFTLPIVANESVENVLSQLKARQIRIIGLDAKAKKSFLLEPSVDRALYAFGNEGHGLSKTLIEQADSLVSIPIDPLCESLNVAVAMGIVLCHAAAGKLSD